MTTGEAIRAELVGNTAVADLVAGRVFPMKLPQGGVLPALVYTVITEQPQSTFTGTPDVLLVNALVQVDAYARTYLEAHQLAAAVDGVIAGLTRDDLSGTRESTRDGYDDETELYRVSSDFSVWR